MKKKVFIDGSAGTTGLRIADRLRDRSDIELTVLSGDDRKNPDCRKRALNSCDAAFLCLPDAAAVEAVSLVENPDTVLIDTSTAHRVSPGWVYGFPELSPQRESAIRTALRIAVPGCHASGFIALIAPLVSAGLIAPDLGLVCHSLTGYSGGGKSMIAEYESGERDALLDAPRQYGTSQRHKHLPEMTRISGLTREPVFCPIVADYYSGMEVTVALFSSYLAEGKGVGDIREVYRGLYRGPVVAYREAAGEGGFFSAGRFSGLDSMEITVEGNDERILLVARYDNLGKGASGAAIQCLNLVLGCEPTAGLVL